MLMSNRVQKTTVEDEFNGCGEWLVDNNHANNRTGLGVLLTDGL